MNTKGRNGSTPLSYAARYGKQTVVRLLLERDDIDMNLQDNDGRTPLSWAVESGYEAVAKLLQSRMNAP